MKKEKVRIFILTIIGIAFILTGILFWIEDDQDLDNSNDNNNIPSEKKVVLKTITDYYDEIIPFSEDEYLILQDDKYGVIDYKGNVIIEPMYEEIVYLMEDYYLVLIDGKYSIINNLGNKVDNMQYEKDEIEGYYGGYYSVTQNDTITLKRNGRVVANNVNAENFKLYKDSNDDNSIYVTITLASETLEENVYAVYDWYNYEYILYNIKTGDILMRTPIDNTSLSEVYFGGADNEASERYVFIPSSQEQQKIIDTKTKKVYNVVSDYLLISSMDPGVFFNEKYFSTGKGVIDNEGNSIIPEMYDDIVFRSNNQKYVAPLKNNKQGLIDFSNNVIMPFEYDLVEVYDDYIIRIKNQTMEILDMNLEVLHTTSYTSEIGPYLRWRRHDGFSAVTNDDVFEIYFSDENGKSNKIIIIDKNKNVRTYTGTDIWSYFGNEYVDVIVDMGENREGTTFTVVNLSNQKLSTLKIGNYNSYEIFMTDDNGSLIIDVDTKPYIATITRNIYNLQDSKWKKETVERFEEMFEVKLQNETYTIAAKGEEFVVCDIDDNVILNKLDYIEDWKEEYIVMSTSDNKYYISQLMYE